MQPKSLKEAFHRFSSDSKRLEATYAALHQHFKEFHQRWRYSYLTLHNIMAYMSEGLIFVSMSGVITLFNPAAERLLRLKAADVKGKLFWDVYTDNCFGFSMREAFSYTHPFTTRGSYDNEEIKELEISLSPIPDHGLILLLRDLTDTKKLEQAVQRNDRLKELGEMAAFLAHEIRNPLGGIQGFASLLVEQLKGHPQAQAMACAIVQGSETLNRLVSSVLAYARPLELTFKQEELSTIVQEAIALAYMEFKIAPQVELESVTLRCDKDLLKLALLNIIRCLLYTSDAADD